MDASKNRGAAALFLLLLLNACCCCCCSGTRLPALIEELKTEPRAVPQGLAPLVLKAAEAECEQNYGFLPCSVGVPGNIFLLIVYGFLMLKAAQFLSEGSEMLLVVLNPGLVGGLLLPILGALPDAILILVSGLFASEDEVESQVLVGMGLLAGSTIMLLTVLWGSSLIVGRCDFQESNGKLVAKDRTLTKGFDLKGTGITTDVQTQYSAWIMILTAVPYILAQFPRIIRKPAVGHLFVIISCILAFLGLVGYCTYQVVSPWIQQRRIDLARHRYRLYRTLHRINLLAKEKSWGNFVHPNGEPNEETLSKLFSYFDEDNSGHLREHELRALIVGLGIGHKSFLPEEKEVQRWMSDFDVSNDHQISQAEFMAGFGKWLKDLKNAKRSSPHEGGWDAEAQNAQTSLLDLMDNQDEDSEEEETQGLTKTQIIIRATGLILLGAVIAGVFADPLVSSIKNFSNATGIPSFFIAFVATPLATNSSEAISSILFAAKKKKQNISLTYSQIYGGVTVNNTLCLGIFLAVVAYRGLTWDYSSEVLVISLVTVVMGVLSGTRTTFPLWNSSIALALYPLSIIIVAFLDYVLGWQ